MYVAKIETVETTKFDFCETCDKKSFEIVEKNNQAFVGDYKPALPTKKKWDYETVTEAVLSLFIFVVFLIVLWQVRSLVWEIQRLEEQNYQLNQKI